MKKIEENQREKSVYLIITGPIELSEKYQDCPWSFVNVVYKSTQGSNNPIHYITTDLRTIIENGWEDDLKYESKEDHRHHEPRPKIKLNYSPESEWIIDLGDNTYVSFLSDWIDYIEKYPRESKPVIQELKDHGYIM